MKTIGLIGGMSWESSAKYYQLINQEVKKQLGGLHSAKCILYSVDFAETQRYQAAGEWERAGQLIGDAALSLEKAGADFIIICTNTMHKVIEYVEEKITIPILHIDLFKRIFKKRQYKFESSDCLLPGIQLGE